MYTVLVDAVCARVLLAYTITTTEAYDLACRVKNAHLNSRITKAISQSCGEPSVALLLP